MKAGIATLGCKVNQYESQVMMDMLCANGFEPVNEGESADVFIVNSCTVTGTSDKKVRQTVRRARREHPDAVILLQTLYNPQTGYIGEAYETAIGFLNEAILKFAGENPDGLYVVDVASRLDDSENDFAGDGIHPSAAGNLKIAVAVLEKLSELGLGESTEPVINTEGVDIEVPFILTFPLTLFGDMLHIISLIYSPLAGIIG